MRKYTLLVLLLLAGCSKGVVPVTGQLTKGSEPITDTMVSLCPVDPGSDKEVAHGGTDQNGKFKLWTLPHEGVLPGEYKIKLTPPMDGRANAQIPKKFTNVMTTPWRVTVTASGIPDLRLDVEKDEIR